MKILELVNIVYSLIANLVYERALLKSILDIANNYIIIQ